MSRRTQTKPGTTLVQAFTYTQQQLPVHKPVVQYIRQSTTKQLKRNKQSYELQDSDLRRNLLAMGWKDNDASIIKIDSDQGKSGTKRRDERTGLDQLYTLVEQDKAGAVAAFDTSRLYRVLSRAEYGAFCDLVLERKIPVITFSRIYWPNRVDNDQLNDSFRADAVFIEEIIKGKLIAAKNRHVEYDFSYGGNFVPFGFTVVGIGDEQADRKFYQEYRPHADLIRWLFRRFKELGGNLPLLARELVQTDFRFPPFEKGITARVAMKPDSDGSFPLRNRQTIISILTNRAYIGFYEYGGMLVSREAHDAVVELTDFVYAFEAITGRTLEGEEIQDRKPRERRYGGAAALLDGVLHSGDTAVYVIDSRYAVRPEINGFPYTELAIPVTTLDKAFSTAMVATLAGIEVARRQGLHEALYEQVTALQQQQEQYAAGYEQSIARIDVEINNAEMARRISKEEGDEQGYRENTKQIVQLNRDRTAIEAKLKQASSEAEELEDCHNLIECAVRDWNGMDVDKRKRLVRLLGVDANLTELSPHFVKLEVLFVSPINRKITMCLHRARGSRLFWTEEEDSILAALFPTADGQVIMEALPRFSWASIVWRGYERLGVRRSATKKDTLSYADLQVMERYGARVDSPVWKVIDTTPQEVAYMARLMWGGRPGHGPLWSCICPVQAL